MRTRLRRVAAVLAAATAVIATSSAAPAAASDSHTQITGSGSSWAANAVNQWIADVTNQGLQIVFTSTGSAQGRKDFAYKTVDFAVSDIPYQGTDPLTGQPDTSLGRSYVYLPIVAGGTSFPYNLSYAGQQIRNLRLSGETLAKIFTDKITYWDDPEIKADNNNKLLLPHIPIIPVVHSEGSGSTAQFTRYLAKQYGQYWGPFNGGQNVPTEYFPKGSTQIAQNGSDGVMNFIRSSAGAGSIGFDEYSYALNSNFPVAKIENKAGYFTAPTQYNDAVALTKAQINQNPKSPEYLTQDLDAVYTNPDRRTYPLSSYSYMIIPTASNDSKTGTTAQRQTLADFLYYSICQGQAEMGPIGYSPLPLYLVKDGFGQIAKLKQADPNVDLANRNVTTCNNPTFDAKSGDLTNNRLAEIAPYPQSCDRAGAGPCGADVGIVNSNPPPTGNPGGNNGGGKTHGGGGKNGGHHHNTGGGGNPQGGTGPGGGNQPGGGNGTGTAPAGGAQQAGSNGGTGNGSVAPGQSPSASTTVDPNTGQIVPVGNSSSSGAAAATGPVVGVPTELAASTTSTAFNSLMYVIAVLLLALLLALPAVLARRAARAREKS